VHELSIEKIQHRQLVEVEAIVEEEDVKAILLHNLPSQYNIVIFTLNGMFSHTLEDMISSLLVEEKRATTRDLEGDFQPKTKLYSKKRMGKRMTSKNGNECLLLWKNKSYNNSLQNLYQ
jgi:hypothetical protein